MPIKWTNMVGMSNQVAIYNALKVYHSYDATMAVLLL